MALNLTIACLLWGHWCSPHSHLYIRALKAAVARFLPVPHRFVCIADEQVGDVETLPIQPFILSFPGNLCKMALYYPHSGLQGRVLAIDLDDIPVGNLEPLASYHGRFCCIEDPWDAGKAGGGTIAFDADNPLLHEQLFWSVVKNPEVAAKNSKGGSERYWLRYQIPGCDFWPKSLIADAKPRNTRKIVDDVPEDAAIMHFHGRPRPHEVDRPWLHSHWKKV